MKNLELTTAQNQELERILIQIKSGYGYYGGQYQKAKTQEEKDFILEKAKNGFTAYYGN